MGNNKDMLNCDSVDCKPLDIDWSETLGENLEGWRAFEALYCDRCEREVVVSSLGEDQHRYIEDRVDVTYEDGSEGDEANGCMEYICFEGPQMNYWYPVKIDDCEEAARAIARYPLCVVEFEDGQTGLALTGGGMDLSWEICGAFVALGYYPPVHFCDLPEMAGMKWTEDTARIVAACKESTRIQGAWAEGKEKRLDELALKLRAN